MHDIMKPKPFAEDLVDACAMRLWREAAWHLIPGMAQRERKSATRIAMAGDFYDLPAYEQGMLRHWARALLGLTCCAMRGGYGPDGLEARLAAIETHLDAASTGHGGRASGEVAHAD